MVIARNRRRAVGGGGGLQNVRRVGQRRSEVRLIPTLKVEWGQERFIASSVLLLFSRPEMSVLAATATRGGGRSICVRVNLYIAVL